MGIIKHPKLEALERECSENLKAALDEAEAFQFAEFDAKEVERTGYSNYSYWGSTFRAFCKNKLALALVFIVLIILAFTFLQPYLPGQFDAFAVNNDPETGIPLRNEPPNSVHWLGTNSIGQDLWSRLWQGTRTSLLIGLAVACIEAVVGITVGVLWGYVRKLDFVFTELYNILDNIPSTVVLILVSYMLRPGVGTIILAMSITSWIGMARMVRAQVMSLKEQEFALAAYVLGASKSRILFKHLVINCMGSIIVNVTLLVPSAIFTEAFLSFVGIGISAPAASWGTLANEARSLIESSNPIQIIWPILAICLTMLSLNFIGDGVSDAFDPKKK